MLEVFFVMALTIAQGKMPPHLEKMADLDSCLKRVEEVSKDLATTTDENFVFTAGCSMRMSKANPA